MNRHLRTLLRNSCAALCCIALLSTACLAQTPGRYAVEITGAESFESLLNDNLEIRRHEADATITPEEWQRLAGSTPKQIRELLATEGYFSPKIEQETVSEPATTILRFNITLGPPTLVDRVEIRFSGAIANGPNADPARIENLQRQWRLQSGAKFRQQGWSEAKNALLKGLLIRDYPAARITQSEAQINPELQMATLLVEVDSGPFFTFGTLQIEGLKRYSQEIIDPLNPIQAGEPFSQDKLTELQARLQDTGYFRSVFATIEVDPEYPENVPVRVNLIENERRRLSVGTGFSTDTGARGQLKWLDRHLFGRNWRLESELRVDRQTRMLGADIYFPALDNGWHPSVGTHYERTDIANVINDKIRADARLTGPIKIDEEAWSTSYLADRQRIADVAINHRQALIGTYSYTKRRVDNLIAPERGYVASIELSAGVSGLLNEQNLGRVVGRGNWLLPIGTNGTKWQTLLRGQVGQVFGAPRETVPSDLLFRTGGDQSVRGYAYNSLGVHVEQNQAVVGGTVMAVISAELVYKITPTWGAAVFRDAGDAAANWHEFRLKQGTGVGARWRSPIGSVNLDLAYGHAANQMRLHFSVGYGF